MDPGLSVDRNAEVPLGSQLAWQIEALIVGDRLKPGERLPSVRGLAQAVGVHVNTIRAVYERLEGEGFVVTRHGRGTFVAEAVPQSRAGSPALRLYGKPASRGGLREQIATLEARLATHIEPVGTSRGGSALLTAEALAAVRDQLAERLAQLDAMRDDLVAILASLRTAIGDEQPTAAPGAPRPRIRSKPKLV